MAMGWKCSIHASLRSHNVHNEFMTLTRCKQKGELQTSCMNILPNNSQFYTMYTVKMPSYTIHTDELESEYMAPCVEVIASPDNVNSSTGVRFRN